MKVKLFVSPIKTKKYRAIFYDKNNNILNQTDFGADGYEDYTIHKDDDRKQNYLNRHKKRENWNNPFSAGALSRWVLWNKPTLKSSWEDYKKRFKLK